MMKNRMKQWSGWEKKVRVEQEHGKGRDCALWPVGQSARLVQVLFSILRSSA